MFFYSIFQVAHEKAKKLEGKKSRDDKDQVMEMLFALFEKHQVPSIYYVITFWEKGVGGKDVFKNVQKCPKMSLGLAKIGQKKCPKLPEKL